MALTWTQCHLSYLLVTQSVSHNQIFKEVRSTAIKKIIHFLQSVATGKNVLIFLIPAMAIYLLMLLYTIPQVTQYSQGMKIFDLLPTGYSYEYAIELLSTLGNDGRDMYLHQQLPMDFIYPGLFAASCCLILAWLFKKSFHANSAMFYFCFVPIAAGLFDYLENTFILRMLTVYPDVTEPHVSVASIMTIFKSAFTTVFFLLLIVGAIMFLRRKRAEKVRYK